MAAKPNEIIAVKVRMKAKTRRFLDAVAKKEGHSLNKEIAIRLERSLIDTTMIAVITDTAEKTAARFAREIIEHIHTLMRDTATEVHRINRTLDLHDLVLKARKGEDRNG
jgi:ribosomal protein L18E